MKTSILVMTAALLVASQPWNQAKATVFIDLDLSDHTTDTVTNNGTWGTGTVGLLNSGTWESAGAWENVNATGNPAGLAYDTVASNTIAGGGKIWWKDTNISTSDLNTLTFYAWLKPEYITSNGANRVFNSYSTSSTGTGNINAMIGKNGSDIMLLQITINGTTHNLNFGDVESSVLGNKSLDNWVFVGMTYNSESGLSTYAGLATDTDLVNVNDDLQNGVIKFSQWYEFTLLDGSSSGNRPFVGSLGEFYLSDEVVDFESVFNSTKYNFIAVPEVSASLLMLAGGALLLGWLHRQRRRAS